MKKLILLLLLLPSLLFADPVGQHAVSIAAKDVGVVEKTNNNDGQRIEQYQRNAGIPKGSPYCVAGVYTWYKESAAELKVVNKLPTVSAAWQLYQIVKKNPLRYKFIPTKDLIRGFEKVEPGDIILWKTGAISGATFKGHGGITEVRLNKSEVGSIEANTLNKNTGDQRGEVKTKGTWGGVFRKVRPINNSSNFLMLGVVRVR